MSSAGRICFLLLALAWPASIQVCAQDADDRAKIPLFAASADHGKRTAGSHASSVESTPRVPVSRLTRQRMTALLQNRATPLPSASPGLAPTGRLSHSPSPGALMMDTFVVEDDPPPVIEVPIPKSRFLEAVRSGKLWRFRDGQIEVVSLGESAAYGHGRITLGVSISW